MKTFSTRLFDLGSEAFKAAKDKLAKIGGSYEFEEGKEITLYIDPCGSWPSLYTVSAHKVVLDGSTIIILGEECNTADDVDWDSSTPNGWREGGCTYAEWDGLFEVIDAIP